MPFDVGDLKSVSDACYAAAELIRTGGSDHALSVSHHIGDEDSEFTSGNPEIHKVMPSQSNSLLAESMYKTLDGVGLGVEALTQNRPGTIDTVLKRQIYLALMRVASGVINLVGPESIETQDTDQNQVWEETPRGYTLASSDASPVDKGAIKLANAIITIAEAFGGVGLEGLLSKVTDVLEKS